MDWTYNILGPDPSAGIMVVLILILIEGVLSVDNAAVLDGGGAIRAAFGLTALSELPASAQRGRPRIGRDLDFVRSGCVDRLECLVWPRRQRRDTFAPLLTSGVSAAT